jgi:hypothetical protein
MTKKLTKKEEKRAVNLIEKIITDISDIHSKNEEKYITEMVNCMVFQADIISRAKKNGIIFEELLPKIKSAYQNLKTIK